VFFLSVFLIYCWHRLLRLYKQVYRTRRRYESRRSSKPKLHFKKQHMTKKRFLIWRMELLNPAMYHDHDIDFARWLHPVMWHVALRWHAMEFAQTSAILEFYIWFRFRSYRRSRHVILHQFAKFYPNQTTLSRKKWRFRFSRWRISAILDFRRPIMVVWKAHVRLPIGRQ